MRLGILISVAMMFPLYGASASNVSQSVELKDSVNQVRLVDAQYDLVPTKTETRMVPGCRPYNETNETCEETIVLETKEVIRVYLSYQDFYNVSDSNEPTFTSVVFEPSDFTAEQVELLKSNYPSWKHPFSNVNRKFAKNNFDLDVKTVKQTVSVVDTRESKPCPPFGESNEPMPGCVENIVYKESWRKVTVVTVTKK